MKRIFLILVLFISNSALADSRNEKIQTLMEAQGLLEMFEQQIELGKQQSEQIGQQAIDQMMSQLNPSEEFKKRFTTAFNTFMSKVEAPWGAKEIVDVWAKYYGSGFTNEELDQLIDFYTSPLGSKEVNVSKGAMVSFSKHFQDASEPIMQTAMSEYINDLKVIARECNCSK